MEYDTSIKNELSDVNKHFSNCLICDEDIVAVMDENHQFLELSQSNVDSICELFKLPMLDGLELNSDSEPALLAYCPACLDRIQTFQVMLAKLNDLIAEMEGIRQEVKQKMFCSNFGSSLPLVSRVRQRITSQLINDPPLEAELIVGLAGSVTSAQEILVTGNDSLQESDPLFIVKEEMEMEGDNEENFAVESEPEAESTIVLANLEQFMPHAMGQKADGDSFSSPNADAEYKATPTAVQTRELDNDDIGIEHKYDDHNPEPENSFSVNCKPTKKPRMTPKPDLNNVYQCSYCTKLCRRLRHLRLHMRIHPEVPLGELDDELPHILVEAPFRCCFASCAEPFIDYRSKVNHERKVHKPVVIPCPVSGCNLFFAKHEWMEKHKSSAHRDR